MKRLALIVVLIFSPVLDSGAGWTIFKEGNELYNSAVACERQEVVECLRYYGFVEGAADAIVITEVFYGTQIGFTNTTCVPERVTIKQQSDVVFLYMKTHPEERHLPGATLVWYALREAFPCSEE